MRLKSMCHILYVNFDTLYKSNESISTLMFGNEWTQIPPLCYDLGRRSRHVSPTNVICHPRCQPAGKGSVFGRRGRVKKDKTHKPLNVIDHAESESRVHLYKSVPLFLQTCQKLEKWASSNVRRNNRWKHHPKQVHHHKNSRNISLQMLTADADDERDR